MLIYIGNGEFIPPFPARDLTDEEVEQFGGEKKLIETGLYAKPEKTKSQDKEGD